MSVTSILRDTPNNVSLVRMISSDTLATVASANYIANQMVNIRALNSGSWSWYVTDMLVVSASDGNAIFTFTDATFSSLNEYSGGSSGVVSPGLINQLAWYAANGTTLSGLATAIDGVLITSHTGVPSWLANSGTPGYALTANSGAPPSWQARVTSTQVQTDAFNSATDTGAVNAYVGVYSPVVTAYTAGMKFTINNLSASNTGAATFNAGGGVKAIVTPNLSALVGNEMLITDSYYLMYNSVLDKFVLLNSSLVATAGPTSTQIQSSAFNTADDAGAANAYVGVFSPVIGAYTDGMIVTLKNIANSNTTTSTLNAGAGAVTVVRSQGLVALIPGDIIAGNDYAFMYSATAGVWLLLNSTQKPLYASYVSGNSLLPFGLDLSFIVYTPVDGATVTVDGFIGQALIEPAAGLTTLTIALPTGDNGQKIFISTTQAVATLTVSSAGNTVLAAPAALTAGQAFSMIYRLSNTTWYPA